jgi:hypothetical protein
MFEPFQKFITEAASRYGIKTEVRAAKICNDFSSMLPEIFEGKEEASNYIQAAYFKNNILVVNVDNPAWSQEVIMRKEKIIKKMNEKAGEEVIKNLRTQLKKISRD